MTYVLQVGGHTYKESGILSAPIHMDNVACYGSEDKLIDCSYRTETSEGGHGDDVWVKCEITSPTADISKEPELTPMSSSDQANNTTSTISLAVGQAVCILLIVLLTVSIVYLYKRKSGARTGTRAKTSK